MGLTQGRAQLAPLLALVLAALLFVSGCTSTPRRSGGTTHVVRSGENLYRISLYYEVPVGKIRRANRVRDVESLRVGARLHIPGTRKRQPRYALTPKGSRTPAVSSRPPRARELGLTFQWPIRGKLSSRFGWRSGRPHEGIDIAARRGKKIHAAAPGRVILAGWLGGYGRVVIVKHRGTYSTVYAHNSKNHVRKGQFVETGQLLAEVGATGRASGPHVHFEIRRDEKPLDPLRYLP
jgi:murein DD-endopeptidase MepM/ murein hydrolase activator NlpD